MKTLALVLMGLLIILAGCAGAPQQGTPGGAGTGGGQPTTPIAPTVPSGGTPSGGTPSGGTPSGSGSGSTMTLVECLAVCTSSGGSFVGLNMCNVGCHSSEAKKTNDANKCEPINQMANMSIFYQECLGGIAGQLKSTDPCKRLTDPNDKDWCLQFAAGEWEDPQVCNEMTGSMMKAICLDNVQPD